jgi:hypothetical protein
MISFNNFGNPFLTLVLLFILLTLVACTGYVANLSLVSTRNVDIETTALDLRKGARVTGEDCGYALLGMIPLEVPSLEDAVDDALKKGKGNIMVDAGTTASVFHAILFSQTCIKVAGTVLRIPEKS